MDANTLVTVITSVLGFIGGIVGSYFMWRKSKAEQSSTDVAELREDLLDFIKTLTAETNSLRDRIHKLEEDVIAKNKEILRLQSYIGKLGQILVENHNLHIDDILKDVA